MDSLKIEDFLPYYVQYDEISDLYPENYNKLYNNITAKKEFNMTALPLSEEMSDVTKTVKGKARKHQEFMARFMSPNTPYNKMLVFHEVGTGKCVHPNTIIYVNNQKVDIKSLWLDQELMDQEVGYEEWIDLSNKNLLTKSSKEGKICEQRIVRAYRQYVEEDLVLYTTKNCKLVCTKRHKLYRNGEWVDYTQLNIGDSIYTIRDLGMNITISENQIINDIITYDYKGYVYDLEVEDTHNYICDNILTHNTCLLSNVVELAKVFNPNMNKPLVLVRGQTIRKNIIKEIANKCFPESYKVARIDLKTQQPLSQETIDRRTTKAVNRVYQIETFYTFAKRIKDLKDKDIEKHFSDRYIFVDEAHRLREKNEEEEKGEKVEVYREIYRLFHTVKNCKILLMTATPMKDRPNEICPIMNLLLPMNKQMYQEQLFDINGKIKDEAKMQEYFKGIVSFVRQEGGKLDVQYMGNVAYNMSEMKTERLYMEDEQDSKYKIDYDTERVDKENIERLEDVEEEAEEVVVEETKKSTLYKKSKNNSLFVFPEGIKNKLVSVGNNYQISSELAQYLKGDDYDEILDNIKKYSVKYEYILRDILNHEKKTFIFCNIVSGSGALLLGALFNLIGYKPLELAGDADVNSFISKAKKDNRYVVLTGKISDSIISKLVDFFNSPSNINGDYLKVIIGSSKISEGLSFKEVRYCYILTPFWNNTETEQAIGRVIRLDSHDRLPPEERTLEIYRLAALPKPTDDNKKAKRVSVDNSIDMIMYKRSEDKDIQIKAVEKILKSSAIDCILNKSRNVRPTDMDGSKDCNYTNCDYKCLFVENIDTIQDIKQTDIIFDTYNLYYANEIISEIKQIIFELFRKKSAYDFEEMFIHLKKLNIKPVLLLRALKEIIYDNVPIVNRTGFVNFLKEDRNLYFLVDDPRVPSVFTYYYYSDRPTPVPDINFGEYIKILNYSTLEDRLRLLKDNFDNLDSSQIEKIVSTFDSNIMDLLLRQFFLSKEESDFKNWFMNRYGEYILKIGEYRVDYYLYNITKDLEDLYYIKIQSKLEWDDWNSCKEESDESEEIKTAFSEYKDRELEFITIDNPYYYYAKLGDKDRFLITKILKPEEMPRTKTGKINLKKIPRGLDCGTGTLTKPLLLFFYMLFGTIATTRGEPKPQPILNKLENKMYNSVITKDITIDQLRNIIRKEKESWNKTFGDTDFKKLVSQHNKESELKITYDYDTIDDIDELKRIYMITKFNEVKGETGNLCPGLKKWFVDVGLFTRFV